MTKYPTTDCHEDDSICHVKTCRRIVQDSKKTNADKTKKIVLYMIL